MWRGGRKEGMKEGRREGGKEGKKGWGGIREVKFPVITWFMYGSGQLSRSHVFPPLHFASTFPPWKG